jgi:hypothetical protein
MDSGLIRPGALPRAASFRGVARARTVASARGRSWLAVALGVAGCGGASRSPATPPEQPSHAAPEVAASPERSDEGVVPPATPSGAVEEARPAVGDPNLHRPVMATAFAAELAALGLDPARLPRLDALPILVKAEVMKPLARAVGLECTGCHASDQDFRTDTRHKRIARRMWNELVVGRNVEGQPLFCDSCHRGSPQILDREHPDGVQAYMRAEYAKRVSGAGGALRCEDCHGEPFRRHIFEEVWQVDSATVAELP